MADLESPIIWFERFKSRTAAFVHDLLMVPVAWLLAFWLRFNLESIPPQHWAGALSSLPWVLAICALTYWAFGLYRGVWRFASVPDLERIAKAAAVSSLLVVALLLALTRLEGVPRTVLFLFPLLQILLLAGPRIGYRWLKDRRIPTRHEIRVLIVGSSGPGESLVRQMRQQRQEGYLPVAFVDDSDRRRGADIHGVPIKGDTGSIPRLVESLGIDLIMLAVPSATASEMRRLIDLCEQTGKPVRTLPQLPNLFDGRVSISQLRPVSIEDLLGREPVMLDWEGLKQDLLGQNILITGAGGSIGLELCRQLVRTNPKRLIVVDHSEFNLYRLERVFSESFPGIDIVSALVDVTDAAEMDTIFAYHQPRIVFHAAAYKHVPMLEHQVRAAVRNNVLGTQVVADCAHRYGAERFVLISTDKAVNPANVMGATKRVAELLCQERARHSHTRFITVRFGNVLGSTGSVVPLFQQQIEQGGPVTLTHPEIERYFMTVSEACQLILQAAIMGQAHEIFVLDMAEPVRIRDLAEQMIRLAGCQPGGDIPIECIGLRPGEKLFEELFYEEETPCPTSHPKIRVASVKARHWGAIREQIDGLIDELGAEGDSARMQRQLEALVPLQALAA